MPLPPTIFVISSPASLPSAYSIPAMTPLLLLNTPSIFSPQGVCLAVFSAWNTISVEKQHGSLPYLLQVFTHTSLCLEYSSFCLLNKLLFSFKTIFLYIFVRVGRVGGFCFVNTLVVAHILFQILAYMYFSPTRL